ncbi:uncharacterized protein CELE_Y47G6A.3 [Caenorhabditis elegans]|uniref:Uncharacterized protein n=1 Tax=Caenorhabditis elegans TaxID=6239 RepID=Q9N3R8_CAEEL|nr:Uncharacterized protein CELE_Y47G6A.3 [Caenorhabditis elegans]CCD72584.1 Uncharacterized protein CELE_Y47G6A.3 [Caenorhabditis elegans]|eukprot:NP_491183.2 Uncharacterized protein CELE_Y47G6A.3 [Caenorhabditis elegans]
MIDRNIIKCAQILVIIQLGFIVPGNAKMQAFSINVTEYSMAYRFNILAIGGIFNMTISLFNLIFALFNFYLIFGRYDLRLRQIAEKLKIAVDEMAGRDLHPKLKMSLSRTIPRGTSMLDDIWKLLKEPSALFDNANDLLPGQKEERIDRMNEKKEEDAKTPKNSKNSKTPKKAKMPKNAKTPRTPKSSASKTPKASTVSGKLEKKKKK